MGKRNITCFVVIGYGKKSDPDTRKEYNLDLSYTELIKPVMDAENIRCFRASDIKHSGQIDTVMYEWILKADIVVADISTLNPNALYELGVRHALKPRTTIVISEKRLRYPFDVNHTVITSYSHAGYRITAKARNEFHKRLRELVQSVLLTKAVDSPVYTHLNRLQPPTQPATRTGSKGQRGKRAKHLPSLDEVVKSVEYAFTVGDYSAAEKLAVEAIKIDRNNEYLIFPQFHLQSTRSCRTL